MTKILKLFVASAALTAAIGLPALSAVHVAPPGEIAKPLAAVLDSGGDGVQFILVDDDDDGEDDDDDGDAKRKQRHSGSDDNDDEDEDDDGGCEDGDDDCGGARAPAPAGTVAPPQNGLFSNGTAPKAQVK